MESLYSQDHRALQAEFGTEALAQFLDAHHVHPDITEEERRFVETRDMFFLSSVDPEGHPTVSYKGGDSAAAGGFVAVLSPTELAFPAYDGNGMFHSMGNIAGQGKVGLLFIDFETPHRLRVQGAARLDREPGLVSRWPGALHAVRVDVTKVWVNCPRYVHRHARVETSRYVPSPDGKAPIPAWKRIDALQPVLPEPDRTRAEAEGLIDMADYGARLSRGEA